MTGYLRSYRKTTGIALLASLLCLLLEGYLIQLPAQDWVLRAASSIAMLVCLGLGGVASFVAAGGIIALKRDAWERAGKPYFEPRPQARTPGIVTRLRRRLLIFMSGSRTRQRLWTGEWVRVRSYAEIAATLDRNASLDALPFMPEMLPYCGKTFRVLRRIDGVHDYFTPGGTGMRRLHDAVTLDDLRCNGAAHGGCQAACQFIWKEAWLEVVDGPSATSAAPPATQAAMPDLCTTRALPDGSVRYLCQMTQLPKAGHLLWWNDPRIFLRSLISGNVRLAFFARAVALALFNYVQKKTRGPQAPHRQVVDRTIDKPAPLNLQLGEIVRVKSKEAIEKTLKNSKNLGLWFDVEMHRYCGGEFRVVGRVKTLINEVDGRLLTLKNPCIVLEGVTGTGEYLGLCPQNELIYWREVWLERVGKALEPEEAQIDETMPSNQPKQNLAGLPKPLAVPHEERS